MTLSKGLQTYKIATHPKVWAVRYPAIRDSAGNLRERATTIAIEATEACARARGALLEVIETVNPAARKAATLRRKIRKANVRLADYIARSQNDLVAIVTAKIARWSAEVEQL
jgi:hypothetical protein